MKQQSEPLGLVLSGGGSRGAYQAGVLKAVMEICPELRFPIITGFSAGALNAAFLASQADRFVVGVEKLVTLWGNLRPSDVYDTNIIRILANAMRLVWDLSFGGLHRMTSTQSLLDTSPLRGLIARNMDFSRIQEHIHSGALRALAVGATDYGTAESVSFFQDNGESEIWRRKRRRAERVEFKTEHILASAALPLLFPAVSVGQGYYGDGSLRNVAPLSSSIRLGANKLMIVGVRKQRESFDEETVIRRPSLGRIIGVILNAILLDTTDTDVERLARINQTIQAMPPESREALALRPIEFIWMTPSEDLGKIAADFVDKLPWIVRYLLRGLGSRQESSELASYLLFDRDFCERLIELGYQDGLRRAQDVREWFEPKKNV